MATLTNNLSMLYNICMKTSTINISLPTSLLNSAREESKKYGFASISEYIRQAIRSSVYGIRDDGLTINGFTPEFEDLVLEAENEPSKNDKVWKTTADIDKYFLEVQNKLKKNGQNKKVRTVRKNVSRSDRFQFAAA